jgi:phage repressor protein C with HTH and peptisase S24 domain
MVSNRLRELRKRCRPKMTLERLAELVQRGSGKKVSYQQLSRLEKGERRMTFEWAEAIAPALGVDPEDLMVGVRKTVPVVGYVGAGSEVMPFDDHAQGEGMDDVPCPRGIDPHNTVALIVRGDSMEPLIQEGWMLFYSRPNEPAPWDVIGKTCVVKVANDGPTLVKRLQRGYTTGKFNLISSNAAPREDVALEWAAPVLAIVSPQAAYSLLPTPADDA